MWATAVPMEQIQQCFADNIGLNSSCHENLLLAQNLIWISIACITPIGLFIPWMISRYMITPLSSILSTIHQVSRGDMQARVNIRAGKEFDSLAAEINQMITFQQQEKDRWMDIHRTQTAVSATRRTMIRETDEKRLLQECCNLFVDSGKYRIAQICYGGKDVHSALSSAAYAEYRNENRDSISKTLLETTSSPTIRAIRNKHIAIIGDIFDDPLYASLQADANRGGYSSIIAIPISADRQILGALTLCAEKPEAFGAEIVQLLMELAEDLGFSIHTLRVSLLTKSQ
jgi:HAMP domain-containing protein